MKNTKKIRMISLLSLISGVATYSVYGAEQSPIQRELAGGKGRGHGVQARIQQFERGGHEPTSTGMPASRVSRHSRVSSLSGLESNDLQQEEVARALPRVSTTTKVDLSTRNQATVCTSNIDEEEMDSADLQDIGTERGAIRSSTIINASRFGKIRNAKQQDLKTRLAEAEHKAKILSPSLESLAATIAFQQWQVASLEATNQGTINPALVRWGTEEFDSEHIGFMYRNNMRILGEWFVQVQSINREVEQTPNQEEMWLSEFIKQAQTLETSAMEIYLKSHELVLSQKALCDRITHLTSINQVKCVPDIIRSHLEQAATLAENYQTRCDELFQGLAAHCESRWNCIQSPDEPLQVENVPLVDLKPEVIMENRFWDVIIAVNLLEQQIRQLGDTNERIASALEAMDRPFKRCFTLDYTLEDLHPSLRFHGSIVSQVSAWFSRNSSSSGEVHLASV